MKRIGTFTVALALAAGTAPAANILKSNTTTMNGAADWSGTAPTSASVGEFGSAPSAATLAGMTLGGNTTLGGLQFDSTMQGPLTIASAGVFTLTLTPAASTSGMDMSAALYDVTMSNVVALGAAQTWTVASGRTLALLGGASGNFNLTKDGPGTLVMTGGTIANSGGKNVTITAGTVKGKAGANGSFLVVNGGTYDLNGSQQKYANFTGAGGSVTNSGVSTTFVIGAANAGGTYQGVIVGGLNLSKLGTSTITLSGVNTYSGTTAIESGGALGIGGSGQLGSGAYAAGIAVNGTFNYNSSAAQTLAGVISGASTGALVQNGPGTLTLSGVNTYTGATSVAAGELVGVTGGSCSNSAVTVAAGATNGVQVLAANGRWACGALTYSAGAACADFNFSGLTPSASAAPLHVVNQLAFTGTPGVLLRNLGTVTNGVYPLIRYGTLSGSAPTSFTAAGITGSISNDTANNLLALVVTKGNTLFWAGGDGTWDIDTTASWKDPNGATGLNYSEGNTVMFDDTASGPSPITVTLNTTVSPASVTANLTIKSYTVSGSGALAGPAVLTKSGTNALTLATANTYTGGTVVNDGVVNVTNDQSAATGGWSVGAANTFSTVVNFQPASVFVVAPANKIQVGNNVQAGGGGIQRLNVSGSVTNNGTLYVGRWGMLIINTGAQWLQGGALSIGAWGGYPTLMKLNSGSTFTYTGTSNIVMSLNLSSGPTLEISGGTFTTGRGFTNTSAGVGAAATINLHDSGILRLTADIDDLFSTAAGTNIFALTGAGTLDTGNNSVTVKTPISDVGSLIKAGSGTLTLAGTNTYSGMTTVSAGTLAITGKIAGGLAVNAGATNLCTGTVGGSVSGAGTLAWQPGQALTVNGTLDVSALKLAVSLAGEQPLGLQTIATCGTLAGAPFAEVTGLPAGGKVAYKVVYDTSSGTVSLLTCLSGTMIRVL